MESSIINDVLAADVSTLGGAARANLSNTFVFKDEKAPPKRSGAGGGGGGIAVSSAVSN